MNDGMRRYLIVLLVLYGINTLYIEVSMVFDQMPVVFSFVLSTFLPFLFAIAHASQRLGWKRMFAMLSLTFAVSLLFESLGVATGWIYGPYHYTDQLGPKFLGLVPLYVPLGWFLMSYPSFVIAGWIVPLDTAPITKRILSVAATGALVMTAWDVVLDPVRVQAGQWVWEVEGAYFGVPLQNYWGWWLTTFITLTVYLLLNRGTDSSPRSASFDQLALVSYMLIGLAEVSAALVLGLSGPAMAGFFAMFPWVLWGWMRMHTV